MADFYKIRKGFKRKNFIKNLDEWYGPWNSIEEFFEELDNNDINDISYGFTIGVFENNKVIEYLWQPYENERQGEFVEKIERNRLILTKFNVLEEQGVIKIIYRVEGKGISPKVTITNSSIYQKAISFDTDIVEYISKGPGTYTFEISINDSVGGTPVEYRVSRSQTISFGELLIRETDLQLIRNLPPQQYLYENKLFRLSIEYNTEKITNLLICLNSHSLGTINATNGKFNQWFRLDSQYFVSGYNIIDVQYDSNGEHKSYLIHDFNILGRDEYAILLSNVPSIGFKDTFLSFNVNIQCGENRTEQLSIVVTLDGENQQIFSNILINNSKLIQYDLTDVQISSINLELRVELVSDSEVSATKYIKIEELHVPKNPIGNEYFTSINRINLNSISIDQNNSNINILFPNKGQLLIREEDIIGNPVINFNSTYFNFDICYTTVLDGSNSKLITIKAGDSIITIGKLKITSSLFIVNDTTYQKELALPTDNSKIHIGIGFQRVIRTTDESCYYYSCIFINGEIVYSTPMLTINGMNPPTNNIKIYFSNSFNIYELCYNNTNVNCVNNAGEPQTLYKLIEGTTYDIFYYNWLSTQENLPLNNNNLTKFRLIPFKHSSSDNLEWWSNFLTLLKGLGKPINKIENFIKFGQVRILKTGLKTGDKELFNFNIEDKETYKLDKKYGVLCRYTFDETVEPQHNKFCIVQVQGTSTLSYPVPNFLFTFIEYNESLNTFTLDDSVGLRYKNPILNNNLSDLFINNNLESTTLIEHETNLVAKADSMDSSHLNNTPTCIYFNSLIDTLSNNKPGFSSFNDEFTEYKNEHGNVVIDKCLDAIVGFPILLEIDEVDTEVGNTIIGYYDNRNYSDIKFSQYGTFMLNIGKSAINMGLDLKIYSLEGLSNETNLENGSPGLFILPSENGNQEALNILDAFNKLTLTNNIEIDDSLLDDSDKELISNYLVSSKSFESRSKFDDDDDFKIDLENDDSEAINHKWETLLPFLRMWLFVNKSSDSLFRSNFTNIFNLDYAILYYINLILFGLADNLGKNMMIDSINGDIWYFRPYDLDSENGMVNVGTDTFPVYGCISEEHFLERYTNGKEPFNNINPLLFNDTYNVYNSSLSVLWTKFWRNFKEEIIQYYGYLRSNNIITPEKIIKIGLTIVKDLISSEQYNIDFYLKHFGTIYTHLNKGGRFLNYTDWITKRFMYVDSYFSYYKFDLILFGRLGQYLKVGKTLIPTFYEFGYNLDLMIVHYGQFDYSTYNENTGTGKYVGRSSMEDNLQYKLKIVPESVTYISPMWGSLSSEITSFINLYSYNGDFNRNVLTLNNIKEISFINTTIDESIVIPSSLRSLKLISCTIDDNALIEFDYSNSNLEELYIENCEYNSNLNLESLVLLKKVELINSIFNNIILSNLNLDELKISYDNAINSLSLFGTITTNNVVNLSGIHTELLNINSNAIEELYLDLLYKCANFGIRTVYELTNKIVSLYSETSEKWSSNMAINGEYVKLNDNTFERIIPTFQTLDLENCSNLKKLSCVGASELLELKIPQSVKSLNLLFCKKLNKLNSNVTGVFNFNNISDLKSEECVIIGRSYNSSYSYHYYYGYLYPESFNLSGCLSVKEIHNLNRLNSNYFKGTYFVTGCENLTTFDNCNITFKELYKTFKMTEKLNYIPETFTFNLSDNSRVTGAFQDSKISFNDVIGRDMTGTGRTIYELLLDDTSFIFAGTMITESIGDPEHPVTIVWSDCEGIFSLPIYYKLNNGTYSNKSFDYESYCSANYNFGKTLFTKGNETYNVYMRLPNAKTIHRMFLGLPVNINSDILTNNNSLTIATCFVANTYLNQLIDFTNCRKLQNLDFCYQNTNISFDETINSCLLPINPTNVNLSIQGLFKDIDLSGVDVINAFNNTSNISNASSCFRNTGCNCTGSPFPVSYANKNVNISGMFSNLDDSENNNTNRVGTIEDISWITENMITSSTGRERARNLVNGNIGGVFEGNIINVDRFDTISGTNRSSQSRMFRNCIISSNQLNFTITGEDSNKIFDSAIINTNISDLKITIGTNVKYLSSGFYNCTIGTLISEIIISKDNTIKDLSYCFSKSSISTNIVFLNENTTLRNLTNASYMFSDSTISPFILPNTDSVIKLFKQCDRLSNIEGIFMKAFSNSNIFDVCIDLSDCVNLNKMNKSFYQANISKLPILNQLLLNLQEVEEAFSKMTLLNSNTINIKIPAVLSILKMFALSTSDLEITIGISNSNINNINGFSTNNNINLNLKTGKSEVSALLIKNYTGGNINLSGSGTIRYTVNGWNNISGTGWNLIEVTDTITK